MNWFKKKLVSLALIGSLVVGISGQAVFASPVTDLNATLASIKSKLSDNELVYVNTAKANFDAYINLGNDSVGNDIWTKIEAKVLPSNLAKDKILRAAVNGLFAKLSLAQLSVGSSSLTLSADEATMLNQLAAIASVTVTTTWDEEVAQFINQVQAELQTNVLTLAGTIFTNNTSSLIPSVITSIQNILKNSNTISNNSIVKILKAYSISASDLNNLISGVRHAIGETAFDDANNAILFAYFRAKADLIFISGSNPATYKLSVFGTDLLSVSSSINWYSSNNAITVTKDESGNVVLRGTPGNTEIEATLNIPTKASLNGKSIFKKTIALGVVTPAQGTGSSTSGPSVTLAPTPTSTPAPIPTPAPALVAEVAKNLNAKLAALPTPAPGQDAQSSQKAATKTVADAIEKQSQLDVSGSVKVTGDTAKVVLDTTQLTGLFKTIKDNADTLNAKLADVQPNAEKAIITAAFDLGVQASANTEIPLSADLIKSAKDTGIDFIAVKVNGVSLTVDVNQFAGATTLNISKKAASEATAATSLKVASDVYEFEFKKVDNSNATFTKPVIVKLPIANVDGLNTDLLVLAKIIDGKLEYYGGNYNAEGKYFEAERKSFSSYVIVENKVNFNDTSSVLAWAGKDIAIAAAKGIIQGRGQGIFAPNDKVTRAEFATMIVKSFHLEDATAVSSFSDVKANDWFASSVAAAAKAGLINGRTASTFEPNATISRAEMATISARALKSVKSYKNTADNAAALAKFNDAGSINASLTEGVALATSQGIVIGSESNFNPNGLSTRAEAAVVISRLLNK